MMKTYQKAKLLRMAGNIAAGYVTGAEVYEDLSDKAARYIASNSLKVAEEILRQAEEKYPDGSQNQKIEE